MRARPIIPHAIPTQPNPVSTQNPQNSNDQTSDHETRPRELHAKLLGRRGLAGLREDAPSEARGADGSRAGRHPPAHSDQTPLVWRTPEGPEGTGGLRDRPLRAVRLACGDLAGGRARRRPEHPWGHKQHKQEGRHTPAHQAARPINTPSGARNASGTTSNTAQGRGPTGPRPQRYDSDANAQKY